jgi:hypothetical protein
MVDSTLSFVSHTPLGRSAPETIRSHFTLTRWSKQPSRVIRFFFRHSDPKENRKVSLNVGAIQKPDRFWYFARRIRAPTLGHLGEPIVHLAPR